MLLQVIKVMNLYSLGQTLRGRFFNPTVFRLINLTIMSFLIAHWIGCMWFFIGEIEVFKIIFKNVYVLTRDMVSTNGFLLLN